MFKKIKNYFKKINEQSIIDNILQEYRSGEINYSNVPLYESQIRLANLKVSSYEFDKKISGMTGEPMRSEYPHDITPMQEMFSNYRGNKNKNFLHELIERKTPNDSLKLWLEFLPREQLLHKEDNDFSPLVYGLIFNIDMFSLLKEIDIKLNEKEIKSAYSVYDTKKGFESLRFALTVGVDSVKHFYDKHPHTINIPFNREKNTALSISASHLQFDTVKYLLSKGAILNAPENENISDDLVTIIQNSTKHFVNEPNLAINSLHVFLKHLLLPKQPDYKLKMNVPTVISILKLTPKQLDSLFDLSKEIHNQNIINVISHVSAHLNQNRFFKYCIDNNLKNFDYKEALSYMINENGSSFEMIKDTLIHLKDSINIKEYITEQNNEGDTFIHFLFRNKSITPDSIQWFKDSNINIFVQNNDGERAFDYLPEDAKKEAQRLYIEEYVKKEKEEISKILIPVNKAAVSTKTRL